MGAHDVVPVSSNGLFAVIAVMAAMLAGAVAVPTVANADKVRNGLIAYTTGNGEEERYTIWTIKPDGTANRRLLGADSRFEGGSSGPRWSRDGKKLLFTRSSDTGEKSLWYLAVATKTTRRVPLPVGRGALAGYDWAPNGRRLVVSLMRSLDDAMLFTLRVDGSRVRKLRPGLDPSWSGDGRHIAFTVYKNRELEPWARTVNVVRASGSGFKRLSAPAANDDWWPSFSPDATTVLYSRQTLSSYEMRPEWRMVDVTGRNDRLVWTRPEQDGFNYWCPPQWTPNGKRLTTIRHEQLTSSGWSAALVTFSLSGQDERRAFTFPAKTVRAFAGVQCQFSWQRAG